MNKQITNLRVLVGLLLTVNLVCLYYIQRLLNEDSYPVYPKDELFTKINTSIEFVEEPNILIDIPAGLDTGLVDVFRSLNYVPSKSRFSEWIYKITFGSKGTTPIIMLIGEESIQIKSITYVPNEDNTGEYHSSVIQLVSYWYQNMEDYRKCYVPCAECMIDCSE